jgi:hypothetical protein
MMNKLVVSVIVHNRDQATFQSATWEAQMHVVPRVGERINLGLYGRPAVVQDVLWEPDLGRSVVTAKAEMLARDFYWAVDSVSNAPGVESFAYDEFRIEGEDGRTSTARFVGTRPQDISGDASPVDNATIRARAAFREIMQWAEPGQLSGTSREILFAVCVGVCGQVREDSPELPIHSIVKQMLVLLGTSGSDAALIDFYRIQDAANETGNADLGTAARSLQVLFGYDVSAEDRRAASIHPAEWLREASLRDAGVGQK